MPASDAAVGAATFMTLLSAAWWTTSQRRGERTKQKQAVPSRTNLVISMPMASDLVSLKAAQDILKAICASLEWDPQGGPGNFEARFGGDR